MTEQVVTENYINFDTKTIGELCDEYNGSVQTGPFGSQLHKSDYTTSGYPIIMPVNMQNGTVNTEKIAYINGEIYEKMSKHHLQKGDIVYARRGDIGRAILITEKEEGWVCGTGCLRIRFNNPKINSNYVYYYLMLESVKQIVRSKAVGTTMANLNTTILRSIQVKYPDLTIQNSITSILSSLDRKASINLTIVDKLEEILCETYKNWFEEFSPFQDDNFQESGIGEIPENWVVENVKKVLNFDRGVEPGSKNYLSEPIENSIPFLRVGDLSDRNGVFINKDLIKKEGILKPKDIVISLDGTVGLVKTGLEGGYSSGIRKVTSKSIDLPNVYIYCFLKSKNTQETINRYATGTTILHAGKSLDYLNIIIPSENILEEFENKFGDLFNYILLIGKENESLYRTKNFLLPLLLAGEIDLTESIELVKEVFMK